MFGLVRLVIMAVILTCLVLVSKRVGVDKPARVKRIALSTVLALIVGMLTTVYPIEDAIISFSSPKDVFKYTMRGTVEHIIDGQSSSMVFGRRSGEKIQYHVIPKSNGKWKIGSITDLKVYHMQIPFPWLSITVERFKNTDDYYITVLDTSSVEKTITDRNGTAYYKGYQDIESGSCLYHAYVYCFDMDYYILVDGEKIQIEPMK